MYFYQVCISCDDQQYCGTSLVLESLVLYLIYGLFFYHDSDVFVWEIQDGSKLMWKYVKINIFLETSELFRPMVAMNDNWM
jgi:hypothetical protein